jgi:pimeloyl-ACP methyl ester carboxylesterase
MWLVARRAGLLPRLAGVSRAGSTTARKMVVTTADNVALSGAAFGSGPRGVVLLPQAGADLCRWWDYANELVTKGFHVLAIDLRGTGYSDAGTSADYTADAAAAVAAVKKDGAQRVVVIGAALGAATALVTAARVPDQVAGVVSLSYPDNGLDVTGGSGDGPHTPIEAAPRITAPLLICFTADDRQAAAAKPEDLLAKVGSTAKQLVGRPGVSHGWDMLKVGDDDVRPDILTFLESYV